MKIETKIKSVSYILSRKRNLNVKRLPLGVFSVSLNPKVTVVAKKPLTVNYKTLMQRREK